MRIDMTRRSSNLTPRFRSMGLHLERVLQELNVCLSVSPPPAYHLIVTPYRLTVTDTGTVCIGWGEKYNESKWGKNKVCVIGVTPGGFRKQKKIYFSPLDTQNWQLLQAAYAVQAQRNRVDEQEEVAAAAAPAAATTAAESEVATVDEDWAAAAAPAPATPAPAPPPPLAPLAAAVESMHTESMHTESMHTEAMHTEAMRTQQLESKVSSLVST